MAIFNTRVYIILLSTIVGISCQSSPANIHQATTDPVISYDSFLNSLKVQKSAVDSGDYKKANASLFQTFHADVPQYWIGTSWDFNGTTQEPGKGDIACGYFLTTTMQQTGYDIKRIWMAQQASSVLIKQYCSDIKISSKLGSIIAYLKSQPDSSCFIIGLDFHTGFVTKNGTDMYIIHSNYIENEGVIKEKIEHSKVLKNNKYFMIGSMTKRKDHIATWMSW